MARQALFFLFATFLIIYVLIENSTSSFTGGCSASPLLSDRPFIVVWNHPTSACEDKGIHFDFDRWSIIDNTRDRFFGQQIVLFYNLGKWPYYDSKNQPVNGGLPQLSDIQTHLTKVDADLKTVVWNKTFSGLGVIDMEHWRPLYWTNYDSHSIYQRQSQALAKQRFPNYNKTQILAEAIKEFNKAARDFMSQTLQKTTTKRPEGKWGYYLFPQCFDATCNTSTLRNNDRISWLFQESSALYPSIYFKLATPRASTASRIKQTLHETFRVKAKYSPQHIPVMPYSKSQEGPYTMYQKMDLSLAVLQPANMGSSGVVIWGSSSDARAKNECLILQNYIDNILGPYSKNITNYFGNCSQQLCNEHGRCVRKDFERIYQKHLQESGRGDCFIPDEVLKYEKILNDELHSDIESTKRVRHRNNKKEAIREKSKFLGFLDHVKNYLTSNLKVKERHKEFFGGRDNKSSKFVINLSIKSLQENKFDNTLRQKRLDLNINPTPNTGDNIKPNSIFDVNAPNYDFDDYVCKCYPGFSGNHCETKHV